MPLALGADVKPQATGWRAALMTGACLSAIALMVAFTIRPSGLLGDEEQYLYLVKGFFTGHPFENLHDMDGSLFLLRPLGYPLMLSMFYPVFHQHWELYPWLNAAFCAGLGMIAFALLRLRMDRGPALLVTLALLANPMIRFWSTNAYSDIPFTFFLLLFFYLYQTRRALNWLPLFAVFMVSLRTSGLPLAAAYGLALGFRKDWIRLGALSGLLAVYFGGQQLWFGEVPGLQEYFRIHVQDSINTERVPLYARMAHNFRSLIFTLLPSTFFYGGYALLQASMMKSLLALAASGGVAFLLMVAAGRSALWNGFIAGYFGVMLVMRPEDLVNRILIPLIPLAFLGAGRLAAVMGTLYFPRVRIATLAGILVCAADGVLSLAAYRKEFTPRDFGDVYRAGEAPSGGGTHGRDSRNDGDTEAPASMNSQSRAPAGAIPESP